MTLSVNSVDEWVLSNKACHKLLANNAVAISHLFCSKKHFTNQVMHHY